MDKKIIYTESGLKAMDTYLASKKAKIEEDIVEKKYVMGDEEIEIAANDINDYEENVYYRDKVNKKYKVLKMLLQVYLLIGLLFIIIGISYSALIKMINENPLQFMLILIGLILIFISAILLSSINNKEKMSLKKS
jgi:cytochrome c biogenesis protein CcdA